MPGTAAMTCHSMRSGPPAVMWRDSGVLMKLRVRRGQSKQSVGGNDPPARCALLPASGRRVGCARSPPRRTLGAPKRPPPARPPRACAAPAPEQTACRGGCGCERGCWHVPWPRPARSLTARPLAAPQPPPRSPCWPAGPRHKQAEQAAHALESLAWPYAGQALYLRRSQLRSSSGSSVAKRCPKLVSATTRPPDAFSLGSSRLARCCAAVGAAEGRASGLGWRRLPAGRRGVRRVPGWRPQRARQRPHLVPHVVGAPLRLKPLLGHLPARQPHDACMSMRSRRADGWVGGRGTGAACSCPAPQQCWAASRALHVRLPSRGGSAPALSTRCVMDGRPATAG